MLTIKKRQTDMSSIHTTNTEIELPQSNINGKYTYIHKLINDSLPYHCVKALCVLTFIEYIFDKVDGLNKLNQHELLATNDHRDMQWIHCGARLDWRIIASGKGT